VPSHLYYLTPVSAYWDPIPCGVCLSRAELDYLSIYFIIRALPQRNETISKRIRTLYLPTCQLHLHLSKPLPLRCTCPSEQNRKKKTRKKQKKKKKRRKKSLSIPCLLSDRITFRYNAQADAANIHTSLTVSCMRPLYHYTYRTVCFTSSPPPFPPHTIVQHNPLKLDHTSSAPI